jgi:hypothetical protein
MNQLLQQLKIKEPTGITETDSCGKHEMVITGMRKIDGKCEVLLRNSQGDQWPHIGTSHGNGSVWIAMDVYLKIRMPNSTLDSISPRIPTAPIANRIVTDQGTFIGKTWKGNFSEGTQIGSDGYKASGVFESFSLVSGRREFKSGEVDNGTYSKNGSLVDGVVTSQGVTETGHFENGAFKCGTYQAVDGKLFCMKDQKLLNETSSLKACSCPSN